MTDADWFVDAQLNFRVRKPSSWQFMGPAWSPAAQIQRAEDLKKALLHHARLPFCCAMGSHGSRAHAYPTLQVMARDAMHYGKELDAPLIEAMIESLIAVHPNFKLLDASGGASLAGFNAIVMRGTYSLWIQPEDRPVEVQVLSRSYLIFAPQAIFTVGLSSSTDPGYYDEADFLQILASISVDH